MASVIAMFEKGGGSFTHVIKASEPVVSVILSLFITGAVPKPLTVLSLLPITYGMDSSEMFSIIIFYNITRCILVL